MKLINKITHRLYDLIVTCSFLSYDERHWLLSFFKIAKIPKKDVKKLLVSLSAMEADELFNLLSEERTAFFKLRKECLEDLTKAEKLLDLNTYTSIYFARKQYADMFNRLRSNARDMESFILLERPKLVNFVIKSNEAFNANFEVIYD
jgi:hypothetical protein